MTIRYPGGFRTSTYVAPTSSVAVGSWTLVEQLQAKKAGNWPAPVIPINYLVVAGGGSGGTGYYSGGGGAGGYLASTVNLNPGATYTVTVGGGGAGVNSNTFGNSGSNSVLSGTGITTVTAVGGGGGAGGTSGSVGVINGASGGSGGGGNSYIYGAGAGGAGTSGQGKTPETTRNQGAVTYLHRFG